MTVIMAPKEAAFRCKIKDVYGIHDGYNLILRPGYTSIVGPNGAGKTTLLNQLEEIARDRSYIVYRYSHLVSGGNAARQKWLENGDITLLAASATSSEGENISIAFGQAVKTIGAAVAKAVKEETPLMVLLDSLDSGASIDRLRSLTGLFNLILKDAGVLGHDRPERGVYIVAAVNAYELAWHGVCVDPRTGKTMTFSDYNDYASYICSYPLGRRKEDHA